MGTPYFTYVLWSPAGNCFYIGVTTCLVTRLAQHNTGISRWTSRHAGTWELAWHREFPGLGEARKYELLLKRQKHGAGFFHLTNLQPPKTVAPSS